MTALRPVRDRGPLFTNPNKFPQIDADGECGLTGTFRPDDRLIHEARHVEHSGRRMVVGTATVDGRRYEVFNTRGGANPWHFVAEISDCSRCNASGMMLDGGEMWECPDCRGTGYVEA